MGQVVILAGGAGTRLRDRLDGLPKPMVSIAGSPLLEHQVRLAKRFDCTDIVMLVSHGAQAIEEYFGAGGEWGVSIRYVEEPVPRGTAGAVLDALDVLSESFVVFYGDTMLDVDLERLRRAHERGGADATLFVHPNDHPHDSDLVETDAAGRIVAFHPYPHDPEQYFPNLVNAALYVVERAAMTPYRELPGLVDFAKQLFPRMLRDGRLLRVYRSPEYIKDVGTPERLDRVESDLRSGVVAGKSLAAKVPAVFLDRDGTLNEEVDRVSMAAELELLDGVAAPLRRLNESVYRTAIVTNQPVIARGDCTELELKEIHNKLETLLGREGAYVDAIYHCPHHPDRGFEGERRELKIVCSCRKPAPGLIHEAAGDMNVDLEHSWLIGDSTTDVMTARNAGLRSVLVRTGHAGRDNRYRARPDFQFFDLSEAVDFILDTYPKLLLRARELTKDVTGGARIIVAGLARTGKSTWASILRDAIEERGHRCVIVSLDNWLRSAHERGPEGVLERYDLPAIEEFAERICRARDVDEYSIPYYDRYKWERKASGDTLRIGPEDVVIFEGVIGLLSSRLKNYASRRFFVNCPDHVRRRNFWAEYRLRGLSEQEIEALFDERESDEKPTILASKSAADRTI